MTTFNPVSNPYDAFRHHISLSVNTVDAYKHAQCIAYHLCEDSADWFLGMVATWYDNAKDASIFDLALAADKLVRAYSDDDRWEYVSPEEMVMAYVAFEIYLDEEILFGIDWYMTH